MTGLVVAMLTMGAPPDFPVAAAAIPGAIAIARGAPGTDPLLARTARGWLLAQMSEFARAYVREPERVAALPPSSPWHQAESAWVQWLNSELPRLSAAESDLVAQSAFVPTTRVAGLRYDHDAFPGFDASGFGLIRLSAWAVTPASYGTMDVWGAYVGESAPDRRRLVHALVTANSQHLSYMVSLSLSADALVEVLDEVGAQEPTFSAALSALGIKAYGMAHANTLATFQHVWRTHPTVRGTLLYAFATHDHGEDPWAHPDGSIWWTHFPQFFGGGATRADLAQFFGRENEYAAPASRWLFSARAEPTSFVDLLVPQLDAWLDRSDTERILFKKDPGHGLEIVVRLVCDDRDEPGLALLRDYFARRAVAHPENDMAHFMDPWPAGACAPESSAAKFRAHAINK